jgi:hypothetical protein
MAQKKKTKAKKPTKRRDFSQIAFDVVRQATGEKPKAKQAGR